MCTQEQSSRNLRKTSHCHQLARTWQIPPCNYISIPFFSNRSPWKTTKLMIPMHASKGMGDWISPRWPLSEREGYPELIWMEDKFCLNQRSLIQEFFGVSVFAAILAWKLLVDNDFLPEDGTIEHMLWALYFLKVYPKQEPACAAVGGSNGAVDPKTFRKYIWPFVYAIADLEQIVESFQTTSDFLFNHRILKFLL